MITLAVITGLTGALAAGPATAATVDNPLNATGANGQIVRTCVAGGHPDIKAFTINGWNQNGNYVATPKRNLEGDRNQTRCYTTDGWWWRGTIDVDFWDDRDNKLGTRQCYVVPNQGPNLQTCTFS
ncbi:hypothetical protein AB0F17_37925 [Nonomuraea sp. NPDC026600]|uniref:hypothetical protein n=1 Tax=Nonomuraea sp. NPDC026600 TaxID=3155363 RepID=UPI0033F1D433